MIEGEVVFLLPVTIESISLIYSEHLLRHKGCAELWDYGRDKFPDVLMNEATEAFEQ